jgi:hypothetical protein
MNPSRFPSLATAAAALAAQMAFAQDAQARVVPIIHDSTLTGIDGLDVDGTLYDVTFVADTGGKSPAPEFTTVHSAHVASKVLGHELKHLENEYLRVDYRDPPYIKGCPHDYDEFVCNIITRDKSPKVLGVELGFVANVTAFYSIATIDHPPRPDDTHIVGFDYAIWTSESNPVTVPEPPPLALLGVGMAGVAAARAVRRKKKSG